MPRKNAPGYIGVRPSEGKFYAFIRARGKAYHLGVFDTAEEAARVRDGVALIETRYECELNFPDSEPITLEQALANKPKRRPRFSRVALLSETEIVETSEGFTVVATYRRTFRERRHAERKIARLPKHI